MHNQESVKSEFLDYDLSIPGDAGSHWDIWVSDRSTKA